MLLLATWLGCSCQPPPPEILIVTVDTLRADRLGFAGHDGAHTPALDALSSRSRWFSQATTPLPRTTPALASLHTGRWPHHHGAREVGDRVEITETLASTLAAAGWQTAAVSAMAVAGPEQGMDQGFDSFHLDHDARAATITEAALSIAAATDPTKPLLMWVHYADPHFPYQPPADGPLQPSAPGCRALVRRVARKQLRRVEIYADRGGVASSVLGGCRALYDAEIAAVDAAIGDLLEGWHTLRRSEGWLDRLRGSPSWIVFSADHGENQGEAGLFYEHGPDVNDASLRIPLLIEGTGVEPGRDDGVVRLEDVLPTLLSLAHVPAPDGLDGLDLGPRLQGLPGEPRIAVAESGSALHAGLFDHVVSGGSRLSCVNGARYSLCRGAGGRQTLHDHSVDPDLREDLAAELPEVVATLEAAAAIWPPESARQRAARTERFKLVGTPQLQGGYSWALYDLAADPSESVDVSSDHPEVVAQLHEALAAWDAPTPEALERDEDELQALRALGYVE
ncbi:MAG TPA: hypothetical protein ENK18_21880 [Deltaproteobacteria bacterium]|nr:hypothetical protein [Deltaproteobacteria bacterium]